MNLPQHHPSEPLRIWWPASPRRAFGAKRSDLGAGARIVQKFQSSSRSRIITMTAALALSALATTALAGDADASEPAWMQIVPSWAPSWLPQLAGRGHVVLVHFPIALLIVAALCEFWGAMRRQIDASRTGLTCLVLGALAAGVSAATGWINADLEGSRASMAETLSLHRWVGVAAAGAALVTALVVAPLLRPGGRGPLGLYRAGVVIAAMLVGVAGHFGGSLVHGENYFWSVIFPQSESASAQRRDQARSLAHRHGHQARHHRFRKDHPPDLRDPLRRMPRTLQEKGRPAPRPPRRRVRPSLGPFHRARQARRERPAPPRHAPAQRP
jgi:uncharacterized membrane protein